jgi:HPt (histidine-containing phosphotransfer) domain-containing protein
MPGVRQVSALPARLNAVHAALEKLKPGDQETLAAVGGVLEGILPVLDGEGPEGRPLIELGLEALQAVFLETVGEPDLVVRCVQRIAADLSAWLRKGSPDDDSAPFDAATELWVVLGRERITSPWYFPTSPPEQDAPGIGGCAASGDLDAREFEPANDEQEAAEVDRPPDSAEPGAGALEGSGDGPTAGSGGFGGDDSLVREFLIESHENLEQLDLDLVALEQSPGDRELLSRIFRTIHTIKGTCGFLGFGRLERVTHVGENLLSRLRDGELGLAGERTDALLALVDAVRQMLAAIEANGAEGPLEFGPLIAQLTRLQEDDVVPAPAPALSQPLELRLADPISPVPATATADAPPPPFAAGGPSAEPVPAVAPPVSDGAAVKGTPVADTTIRVDVGLLDRLMNQVGELVLARNQVLQLTAGNGNSALIAASQRLNLITTELQEGVMKTRMQPIGNVWSKRMFDN